MHRADAVKLLKRLRNAYPGQQITDETAREYVEHISKWSKDVGEAAVSAAITESTWFPTIADLSTRVSERIPSRHGDQLEAEIEWLMRFRKVNRETAKDILVRTFRDNFDAEPDGPWKAHLAALGVPA